MDFLTTEVTKYKTGCLVNFLPCMAIYICSRPGTLWSDSLTILPCLWSILRDWMQNTLTAWQHIVLWQWGPLSQPACCQDKSYPRKTHPVIVRRAGLLWSQQDFEWRWSVPLFKCLTVLEFSFILFDLCLLITFFNFIMNYVPIVTFWIFIYHEIWILLNIFLYETIELFILWHVWRYSGVLWVNSCPPLTRPHQRQSCMSGQALLHHWLCNQKHPWGICSCSPIVNFLKVTFYHEMVSLVIFLIKKSSK